MGERFRVDYLGEMRWGVIDTANGRLVGIDGGEPEDQLLCRDWKWVPEELNKLAATLAARDERVRELSEELQERETVCDMWRSSVSEGIEERDRLRARIATLERELAEARPIVQVARFYYQAELAGNEKGMLAGLRAIQAAFERGTIADHARRMAPAEEPREVVEPKSAVGLAVEELQRRQVVADLAPAPARYRCEGCGWDGEAGDLATSNGHVAIVQDANGDPEPNLCGPCVPITDAQPAGAAP